MKAEYIRLSFFLLNGLFGAVVWLAINYLFNKDIGRLTGGELALWNATPILFISFIVVGVFISHRPKRKGAK